MWGPSIVGYGRYAYRYESGRTGEMCLTGFSVRGKDLVLYLLADGPEQENYEMNRDQIEVRLSAEDLVKAKGMSDRCLETRYAECD